MDISNKLNNLYILLDNLEKRERKIASYLENNPPKYKGILDRSPASSSRSGDKYVQKFSFSDLEDVQQTIASAKNEIDDIQKAQAEDKRIRPRTWNEKQKQNCREIARKLWHENKEMTIASMIEHPEIIEYTKHLDGTRLSVSARRNWIKDLCPNNSPGRRRKQR